MYVVDSSVWVAWFWERDSHHRRADGWLTEAHIREIPLFGPPILLAEVAGAVARRSQSSEIGRMALQPLLNYRELNIIDMGPDTTSFVVELAADLRLRVADAAFLAVAMLQDPPLITFDNEQRERARDMVAAEAPPETQLY